MTQIYPVTAQVISLTLIIIGFVLSLVGALDLIMSMSGLVNSVMHSGNADTDIGVGLLRGILSLVLGVILMFISSKTSELLENVYHHIEDAFLK